jgi:hypothetical protein
MNIYIVSSREYWAEGLFPEDNAAEAIECPRAAFASKEEAEAYAAAKNLDAAWASNEPDWDCFKCDYRVMSYTIPFHSASASTPVDKH